MKDIALRALDLVAGRATEYADVRAIESRDREITTKNGRPGHVASASGEGLGIRVLAGGNWGFAATDDLSKQGIEAAAGLALEIARSGAAARKHGVVLAPEGKFEATWASPMAIDPFSIPIDRQLGELLAVDAAIRAVDGISLAEASMHFTRSRQVFVSTLGSVIDQTRCMSGAGFSALCYQDGEIQKRSFPNSFGGQYQLKGYELVAELKMREHAGPIAEQAVALHSADQCPEGEFDLVLDSSQLGLQIHESIGHPIELDRVLGSEANYAGMSFLTLDQLRTLRYGSPIVNVVCDATLEHGPGLGTFAFDDEGVPAHRTPIITSGLFTGYMTSRETAAAVGDVRSNGCMRADGWSRIPLIRMTNVSLEPGRQSLEEVFDADGIYMETNRSWSIDDKRYNFQFGCEIGWEIRGGKRIRMLKNPSYSGISTEFWNACEAIADRRHWTLWGVPNCGKGQPEQVMGTGHGASPSRFRKIKVGGAYAG
jgi:TldD protein